MGEARGHSSVDLPAHLTRFVGREAEAAALTSALIAERLVTVVGPPGCGKTRLSVEIVPRVASSYPEGVWFVDLAAVTVAGPVAEAVASTLGIRGQPGRTAAESIVSALAGAESLLVVLDNCEHVAAEVADVVQGLLSRCPAVGVLATSRCPLGLVGERVWTLQPLEVAVAADLFGDRAGLVGHPITPAPADQTAVEEICTLLGCLPLGIELAAASCRILSLRQIASRLSENLPLVTTPGHDRSPRQETLATTIEWSYRLLDPEAQQLLLRLSVFAGGFDLDAAGAVAGTGGEVLSGLSTLVDHSLVSTEPAGPEPMRYRLLEPIRQWAEARLAASKDIDVEEVRLCHAQHYLWLFGQFDPFGARMVERPLLLPRVKRDEANALSALRWARDQPGDFLARLCIPLCDYWYCVGRGNEGWAWVEEAVARGGPDQWVRGFLALGAGVLATKVDDMRRAEVLLEESMAVLRRAGNGEYLVAVVHALNFRGVIEISRDNYRRAMSHSQEGIAIAQGLGHVVGECYARIILGWSCIVAKDVAGATFQFDRVIATSSATGPHAFTLRAQAHHGLAWGAVFITGDTGRTRNHLMSALAAIADGGFAERPDVLMVGAALALAEERYDAGLRVLGAAEAMNRRRGGTFPHSVMSDGRPMVRRALDTVGRARAKQLVASGSRMRWDEVVAEAVAPPGERVKPLSRRENEVAELVARGLGNVEIAGILYISRRTVETHVQNIKRKLGVTARHQLVEPVDVSTKRAP